MNHKSYVVSGSKEYIARVIANAATIEGVIEVGVKRGDTSAYIDYDADVTSLGVINRTLDQYRVTVLGGDRAGD